MKKILVKVLCLVLIMALLTGLTGCTTYNNFKNAFFGGNIQATEKTIKIGVYEPVTGAFKAQGKEEIMGIELAHDLYPAVLGKNIELVYADNKSNIYDAETAIQELMSHSPLAVLGSYGETLTLVASDYIKASNTPAITISSTNPLITANNAYFFSATYSETRQGDALADFAYESQFKDTVATLKLSKDDMATATIKRFTNRVKKLTGNNKSVVCNLAVSDDLTDYTATIERLRDSGAKAIFITLPPTKAQKFMEQCIENNFTHVLFLGTRNWNDEKFIEFVKSNDKLDVAFCAEQPQEADATGLTEIFLAAYREKYGEDSLPSARTAVAFDSYVMLIKAIENAYEYALTADPEELTADAKSEAEAKAIKEAIQKAVDEGVPTGTQVRLALSNLNGFEGVSGVIDYDGNNEATKTVNIIHIDGGQDMPAFAAE